MGEGLRDGWVAVKRRVEFVPAEATALAAQYRGLGRRLSEFAVDLRTVMWEMDATWAGHAKDMVFGEYGIEPDKVDTFAQWVEWEAGRIARITVVRWETMWVQPEGVE